jgi:hypothetical protein
LLGLLLPLTAAAGFPGIGCQTTPAATQGENTAGTTQALCSDTVSGGQETLSFSTALGCEKSAGAESCALSAFTLRATVQLDQAAGVSTTRWTMMRGDTPVVTKAVRASNGASSIDVELGALSSGVHKFNVVYDGKTVTGSADARALVPLDLSHPEASALTFSDDQSKPQVTLPPEVEAAARQLLDEAVAETASACGNAAEHPAISALRSALLPDAPHGSADAAHASSETPPGSGAAPLRGVPSVPKGVDRALPPSAPPLAPTNVREFDFSFGTLGGGASTTEYQNRQNTPTDFETHDCQNCQSNCATSASSYLIPFQLWICMGECWQPGHGCAEVLCSGNSCDTGESCCGPGCCGAGSVCGNTQYGECCPSEDPVGCGDETLIQCFPAGSVCCGNLTQACPAGSVCTNVTGTTATCCQAGNIASDGTCCQEQPCGGQCCDGGACLNGNTCCYGPVSSSGTCCGFGENVCNGQCCAGNCASDGSCIPYGSGTFNQLGRLSAEGATAEYMFPGQTLYSEGGIGGGETPSGCGFLLVMQHDGNLVLYGSQAWWSTGTWNPNATDLNYAVLQGDGNFVEYAFAGGALWSSGSYDFGDEEVVMQGDGNLVVYRGDWSVPFATTDQSWLKTPITLQGGGACDQPNGYPLISETTIMEANADRPGGDYSFLASPDQVNCANLCAQDRSNCRAYSWVPAGAAGNSGPVCCLKNSVPAKVSDGRGIVTGYVRGRNGGSTYIPR